MNIYNNDENYVVNYKRNKDKTSELEVKFPKKRIFKNLKYSEENIAKLNDKMREQAMEAVEKIPKYNTKRVMSTLGVTYLSLTGFLFGAADIFTNTTRLTEKELIAASTISLFGAIGCAIKNKKNSEKIEELNKYKYYFENEEMLKRFEEYPNALAGLKSEKEEQIKNNKNIFKTIKSLDKIDQKSMEIITENINTESNFNFDYQKLK